MANIHESLATLGSGFTARFDSVKDGSVSVAQKVASTISGLRPQSPNLLLEQPTYNVGSDWMFGGFASSGERMLSADSVYPLSKEFGIDPKKVEALYDEKHEVAARTLVLSASNYFEGNALHEYQEQAQKVTTLRESLTLMRESGVFEIMADRMKDKLPKNRADVYRLATDRRTIALAAMAITLATASPAEASGNLPGGENWFMNYLGDIKDRPGNVIATFAAIGAAWGVIASTIGVYRASVAERQAKLKNPADFKSKLTLENIFNLYVNNMFTETVEWGGVIAELSMGLNYYDMKAASESGLGLHEIAVMIFGGYQIIHNFKHAFEARLNL